MGDPPLAGERKRSGVCFSGEMGDSGAPLIGTLLCLVMRKRLTDKSLQIYDITQGIEFIHGRERPICHGDLKSVRGRLAHLNSIESNRQCPVVKRLSQLPVSRRYYRFWLR